MEAKLVKIDAYKCPFCDETSIDKLKIEKHMESCCRNPNYTQKCIDCYALYKDFLYQNLCDKGICRHSGYPSAKCPYVNHDDTEVREEIMKNNDNYIKFINYDSSKTVEENWENEEKYDVLRTKGHSPDEAGKLVYGERYVK